jgi:hypothetical protein
VATEVLPVEDDVGAELPVLPVLVEVLLVLELVPEVDVLVEPVVLVVAVDAFVVVLWLASTATAPVPTPAIAMSPMVAMATRRLPSSLVVTASPLVCGWPFDLPSESSFGRQPMDHLCVRRGIPRLEIRGQSAHTASLTVHS